MQNILKMNVSSVGQPLTENPFHALTLLCEEAVLLGITVTSLPHHYSVARETDGMPLQVSAEVGVKASLPHRESVEATW